MCNDVDMIIPKEVLRCYEGVLILGLRDDPYFPDTLKLHR